MVTDITNAMIAHYQLRKLTDLNNYYLYQRGGFAVLFYIARHVEIYFISDPKIGNKRKADGKKTVLRMILDNHTPAKNKGPFSIETCIEVMKGLKDCEMVTLAYEDPTTLPFRRSRFRVRTC